MYEEITTLSGLVLFAYLTQSDFYNEQPIQVFVDNPVSGEISTIEMDPEHFVDLLDLMSTSRELPGGPILRPLGCYYDT